MFASAQRGFSPKIEPACFRVCLLPATPTSEYSGVCPNVCAPSDTKIAVVDLLYSVCSWNRNHKSRVAMVLALHPSACRLLLCVWLESTATIAVLEA